MGHAKLLSFISFLASQTDTHTQDLKTLYRTVLEDDPVYSELHHLLTDSIFQAEAAEWRNMADKTVRALQMDPEHVQANLNRAASLLAELKTSKKTMTKDLNGWNLTGLDLKLLPSDQLPAYLEAYRQILFAAFAMLLILVGPEKITKILYNPRARLQDLISQLRHQVLPDVLEAFHSVQPWMIYCLNSGTGKYQKRYFILSRADQSIYSRLCQNSRSISFAPLCWYNPDWSASPAERVGYCWGVGNIVLGIKDHLESILNSSFITVMNTPGTLQTSVPVPSPYQVITDLAGSHSCCVKPEQLVLALNQWQSGYSFQNDLSGHHCILCGKQIRTGEVLCQSHLQKSWIPDSYDSLDYVTP